MKILMIDTPITHLPCAHTIKIKAKFVTVPILNENGYLQLSRRGASVSVKSIVSCANPCCERVFDYEPINGKRIRKEESFSSGSSIANNN